MFDRTSEQGEQDRVKVALVCRAAQRVAAGDNSNLEEGVMIVSCRFAILFHFFVFEDFLYRVRKKLATLYYSTDMVMLAFTPVIVVFLLHYRPW